MKYWVKLLLACLFVGASATTAVAVSDSGSELKTTLDAPTKERAEAMRKHRGRHLKRFGKGMVTGEFKVQTRDGFATVRINQGTVTAVGSNSLTLKRADGETVTVPVASDTKIRKDREEVKLGDIKVGDLVRAAERNEGSGFKTESIRAHTPSADATESETAKPTSLGV